MQMLRDVFRQCRWLLLLWVGVLLVVTSLAAWELHAARDDGVQRLAMEARRIAERSGGILALPAWRLDELAARSIVMGEMDDPRIYAMLVSNTQGILEGQRRDDQWEAVPWDDLVPDGMVEGAATLMLEDRQVGNVRVYLSPRQMEEGMAALWWREAVRVLLLGGLATVLLAWGMYRKRHAALVPAASIPLPETLPGLHVAEAVCALGGQSRTYLVLADLFRQLYARVPELLLWLASREDTVALGKLTRSLRDGAGALGALELRAAAVQLEDALREQPDAVARHVENCSSALALVLESLRSLPLGGSC